MRKLFTATLGLATALVLAAPTDAEAQSGSFNICGAFDACASVDWQVIGDGTDLKLTIMNVPAVLDDDNRNSVLTKLLIKVKGVGVDNFLSPASVTSSTLSGYQVVRDGHPNPNRDTFNQIGFDWTQKIATGDGTCTGVVTTSADDLPCGPNGNFATTLMITLDYDEQVQALVNVAGQFQNLGPNGEQSTWAVVPEPTTMVLLGTGLAGMGAAALRRRRRENGELVDE